jgi:small subunit ribosomal protein S2
VDVKREHIAVAEAIKLNIPVFAMVDTNSDPTIVDYPIPANDDAYKSIAIITNLMGKAVEEGLLDRKKDKDDAKLQEEEDYKKSIDKGSEEEVEEEASVEKNVEDKSEE